MVFFRSEENLLRSLRDILANLNESLGSKPEEDSDVCFGIAPVPEEYVHCRTRDGLPTLLLTLPDDEMVARENADVNRLRLVAVVVDEEVEPVDFGFLTNEKKSRIMLFFSGVGSFIGDLGAILAAFIRSTIAQVSVGLETVIGGIAMTILEGDVRFTSGGR